jgi:hypothetical protein
MVGASEKSWGKFVSTLWFS